MAGERVVSIAAPPYVALKRMLKPRHEGLVSVAMLYPPAVVAVTAGLAGEKLLPSKVPSKVTPDALPIKRRPPTNVRNGVVDELAPVRTSGLAMTPVTAQDPDSPLVMVAPCNQMMEQGKFSVMVSGVVLGSNRVSWGSALAVHTHLVVELAQYTRPSPENPALQTQSPAGVVQLALAAQGMTPFLQNTVWP